jgi:hypothetical protein
MYGSRFYGRPHRSLYFYHYLGNRLMSFWFNLLYDQMLSDIVYGNDYGYDGHHLKGVSVSVPSVEPSSTMTIRFGIAWAARPLS